ncbi:MAG TPA: tetratricopeptide repeat protein [Streptosporangiaceae bacterium]|nr:tetratricopeptide repeat protein [Streptosporangiaceae bacterium]
MPAPLPAEPNSFIGRERELRELDRLVRANRVLTLCGPGGIGKTRLALRLLASVTASPDGEFPDGVCFVELGDLTQGELVPSRVAAALGVSEEPGRPLADTVADVLEPRRLLLALDTCEHLRGACARLAERLLARSPGLRLVATSREPLRVAGEMTWQVPPLTVTVPPSDGLAAPAADPALGVPVSEAVRLFADRAAASRPGFTLGPGNAAAVTSICRQLDGLPLAIELAAARVRVLAAEQIRHRLGDRFGLLTAGDRAAAPRQRTLRATIGWSYEMLTAAERTLFARLSVFAGWSAEMAEQVCAGDDLPARDVAGLTDALAAKSLVTREPEALGEARFRMLDIIREYAAARLAEAGETGEFQAALRDYVLRTAERHLAIGMAPDTVPWPDRVDCSRRYDIDSGNVSQALAWCLAQADPESGLRICVAVAPRWIVWGTLTEGGEWLDRFLAMDGAALPARVHGAALVTRAQLVVSGDPAAAGALAGRGLNLCQAAGDDYWTAAALNLLSEIALRAGQAGQAAARADQALSIAQAAGDGWNEGYALGTRAAIAARRGRLREAGQLASASVSVMRRIDQQWGVARALLGLGDLARLRDDPAAAHEWYMDALPILQEIDARPEIARCLAGLGRVAMDLGATEQARRYLARSIQLSQATGVRISIARGLEAFAALAGLEERPGLAVQLAAAAAALRERAGLPPGRGTGSFLAQARPLGEATAARLWERGLAMSRETAVALALETPPAETPPLETLSAAVRHTPALTLAPPHGPDQPIHGS